MKSNLYKAFRIYYYLMWVAPEFNRNFIFLITSRNTRCGDKVISSETDCIKNVMRADSFIIYIKEKLHQKKSFVWRNRTNIPKGYFCCHSVCQKVNDRNGRCRIYLYENYFWPKENSRNFSKNMLISITIPLLTNILSILQISTKF